MQHVNWIVVADPARARIFAADADAKALDEIADLDPETQLSSYLDSARSAHRYERVYLIASPRFLGRLRRNLSPEVLKRVSDTLDKDVSSWCDAREIVRYARKHAP